MKFVEKCFKSLNLGDYVFPKSLKQRGVDDSEKLPGFYYRDDGLKLWEALRSFIAEILGIYYKGDKDVQNDSEIQSWIFDVHKNGWRVNEGHLDHGVPKSITSFDQLVEILTTLCFTFSCQHGAVNFSQKDHYGFTPNAPALMRQPPPTKKGGASLKSILQSLPNKNQASKAIVTVYILTKYSEDEVRTCLLFSLTQNMIFIEVYLALVNIGRLHSLQYIKKNIGEGNFECEIFPDVHVDADSDADVDGECGRLVGCRFNADVDVDLDVDVNTES